MPNLTQFPASDTAVKTFGNIVATIAAGTSLVVDARGMSIFSVITAGGTATVSRVNSDSAVADAVATAANQSVSTATKLSIAVDWPFYRVTAATAACDVACV